MASVFQDAFGEFMGMDEERVAASDLRTICAMYGATFKVPEWVLTNRPEIVSVMALATPQELSLMVGAYGMADALRVFGIDLGAIPELRLAPAKTKWRIQEEQEGSTRQLRRGW